MEMIDQSLETLESALFWITLCPFLSVTSDFSSLLFSQSEASASSRGLEMNLNGFFKVPRCKMQLPTGWEDLLVRGIKILQAHGFHPNFILLYDEAWMVGELIGQTVEQASGNVPIGDWFVFSCDESGGYSPGGPHRDRPMADRASGFRDAVDHCVSAPQEPRPNYCSAWLALTAATTENSCLYLVPKPYDAGYFTAGDDDVRAISIGSVEALPVEQGGLLVFSHRTVHWGSQVRDRSYAAPRIALSLAFATPCFEPAYFDACHLPCPPLGLRLGLAAGQLIQYRHLDPPHTQPRPTTTMSSSPKDLPDIPVPAPTPASVRAAIRRHRHDLALYRRVFHAQKRFFCAEYFDKIASKAQFLQFSAAMT
eukprot:gene25792-34376_t